MSVGIWHPAIFTNRGSTSGNAPQWATKLEQAAPEP